MKKMLLMLTLLFTITMVNAQNYNFLGEYTSNGTPLYMEAERDVISYETQDLISNALPESFPVPEYNPHYITSGYDTDVSLDEDADVYVTFVSEGAGYKNVLGFYTYPVGNPPAVRPPVEDITIIFPNVSALGSGGGLYIGDKVKIGTFSSGTAIGWVLLANAWRHGYVGDAYWDLFSNPIYNPEPIASLQHHNVLLVDESNEKLLLGFEDIRRDYSFCDNDFNDAIFYVTANPFSALICTNYVDMSEATQDVSSSNTGGLESNGNLASLVAKRNFIRVKTDSRADEKSMQKVFNKKQRKASNTNTTKLESYLPETGMYKTEIAQISSPIDLLEITNAIEVFSIDMYQGENRVSAALAIATLGSVYDHSKAICDRLNFSTLEDVRPVTVRGHRIISSKIIRSNGQKEFTLGFSVKLGETSNEVLSFWGTDQYPEGDYYNFQIWGSSFAQVFTIANHIFDTLSEEKELISTDIEDKTPIVFVKSGNYKNGKITLDIVNRVRTKEMFFTAIISSTEVSDKTYMDQPISLSGDWFETVVIETGTLFDIGISIATEASAQKDILYLADGPWGVDYSTELDHIEKFDITTNEGFIAEDSHKVERNLSVAGELKGTINMFRHLMAGDQVLDVQDYDAIEFEIESTQRIEIVLMTDDISDWSKRLRKTIEPSFEKEKMIIMFSDFVDDDGHTIDLKTIRTLVFSVQGDYLNKVDFSVDIENVALVYGKVASTVTVVSSDNVLKNYPNPFVSSTTIEIPTSARSATIKVYDLMGRLVDVKSLDITNGTQLIYNARVSLKGVFRYIITTNDSKEYKGSLLIQ